ncbi:MAG: hypothetical protein E6R03_17225 [Hyphomicrobiaceae bacterium]|nr:MAG: hypothetical protein E6R03_17225 [Hyphomicrobiaceae bacterium]
MDADYVPADVLKDVRKLARKVGARVETKRDKRGVAVRVFTKLAHAREFRTVLGEYVSNRIIW